MKTTELRYFYKILSELNNSFTHYSFVWNQFSIDYFKLLKENPDTLTKDYFNSNPFHRAHNIRFSELENEHTKTNKTLIEGIYLLIYTHYESYLKSVLSFSKGVDESIKSFEDKLDDLDSDFSTLDKVFNRVGVDKSLLDSEILDSLDYLRLKRNRLTHRNAENISHSLNDLIKLKGVKLNSYWNLNLPSKLQGIDFVDKENANALTFSIVIDSINIFRKASNEIDKLITDKLTIDRITQQIIIPDFKRLQKGKLNGLKKERIISKFKRFCDSEYAMEIDDQKIELLISSIA